MKIQKLNITSCFKRSNLYFFSRFSWARKRVNLAIEFRVFLVIHHILTQALALRNSCLLRKKTLVLLLQK